MLEEGKAGRIPLSGFKIAFSAKTGLEGWLLCSFATSRFLPLLLLNLYSQTELGRSRNRNGSGVSMCCPDKVTCPRERDLCPIPAALALHYSLNFLPKCFGCQKL